MKLLESFGGTKGITLNAQLVELLDILDQKMPEEEQDRKIIEYIQMVKETSERYASLEGADRHKTFVEDVITQVEGITEEQRQELKNIYFSALKDLSVCNKQEMQKRLQEHGLDPKLHTTLAQINIETLAKEGILELTPEKVRQLHDHMFKDGNRYDRVTFDNVGKYSGYVAFDGETYTPDKMEKMLQFCERHKMKAKVNTLMFYADFPKTLEASLLKRVENGEITKEQMKDILKQSLINYARDIGTRFGDRIDTVDIFNELIYDPVMKEPGFDEDPTYHERYNGWQKYLSLEDLCEMALEARRVMPNVTFTYNDMNWVNPEKREHIIDIIKKIQVIEAKYRQEGKLGKKGLIDTIGVEAHLGTDVDLGEIDKTFEEIEEEIGLPVEVTEFDVARGGENPASRREEVLQQKVFERFWKIAQKNSKLTAFTIWSQSDSLSFMNDKAGRMVYASLLDDNFEEKSFELSRDEQNFNFHTHTHLCGHADKKSTIRDYAIAAFKEGMPVLGFSDHAPSPFGYNPNVAMSIKQFEEEYIPTLKLLKQEVEGKLDIRIGLEAEYFGDDGEQYRIVKELREMTEPYLDYMILGQHMELSRDENGRLKTPPETSKQNSKQYPLDYAMTVVEAIKTGKFAYVAHPDIFMEKRDQVPEEELDEYMKNAKKAMEMICEASREYDIPLEVNLGSIAAIEGNVPGKHKTKDGEYPYPVAEFWKVAEEKGCKVLIGIDAHDPNAIRDRRPERIARKLLEDAGIKLEFLESFEPKGIGKEIKRDEITFTLLDVGKAFAERSMDGKAVADDVVRADKKQVVQERETKTEETK